MKVTFLGTSGAIPTTQRNPSALVIEREGERLLFDCGEGTQRQMMRYNSGFDIEHVFLTHLHGDHVLGIPGLLQTFDFNEREQPLTIHTPSGTRSELEQLTSVVGTDPSYPLYIRQVQPGTTVVSHEEYEIRAFEVNHRTQAVGYALVEDDRKGRFDREKAESEFGIPPGPKYSKLHAGESVEHDGRRIEPEEVVGPPRPGRRVVYTGDTRPTETTRRVAEDADLLIHDGTFTDEHQSRAQQTAHSTAREAGRIASQSGVKALALTHLSSRYGGYWRSHAGEASEVFDGQVIPAEDGMTMTVPFPDSDESILIDQPHR